MKLTVTVYQDADGMYIAECPAIAGCVSQGLSEKEALKNVRQAIKECLEKTGWNRSKAAQLLGINRNTLHSKMDEYAIKS